MPDSRWVTVADVRDRWIGDGFPDETTVVERLVRDAEEVVLFEYPDVEGRLVGDPPPDPLPDDPLPLERLVMVVCRMVERRLRNPEGIRQVTETSGPFSNNRTYGGEAPGQLVLTDEERRMLGYTPGAPRPRAFTVPQPAPATTTYLSGSSDVW